MKKLILLVFMLAALMLPLTGCKSTEAKSDSPAAAPAEKSAKATKSKGKKTFYILFDKGITKDMAEPQAKAQGQIAEYMKKDLLDRLKKHTKANTVAIDSTSGFEKGQGAYLLSVKVRKYNPGSSAARYWVGFGAGAASMDISYTLKDGSGKVILSKDDGVGTGGHWKRIAVKLNDNMVKEIKPRI